MKNKEIEELLNNIKDKYSYEPYDNTGNVYTTISYEEGQLLLSYIEQLKNNKEKEYVLVGRMQLKTRDYIHQLEKENQQLENNRDKAIEYIENDILDNKINEVDWDFDECYFSDMPAERIKPLIDILKGDSDG